MITAQKEKQIELDSFFARVLSNVDYSQPAPETLREAENLSLIDTLNRIAERGASFDVGADKFNTFGTVKDSDKDFLSINRDSTLCTLQQSLLMKHLFSHSPSSFSDFAFEIAECSALLVENGIDEEAAEAAKSFAFERWQTSEGYYGHQAVVMPVTNAFYEAADKARAEGVLDMSEDETERVFTFDDLDADILT